MNEFLVFYVKQGQNAEAAIEALVASIPALTPYRVLESWRSPRGAIVLLNLALNGAASDASARSNRIHHADEKTLLMTGYVTEAPSACLRALQLRAGQLHSRDTGGIAAFCLASTRPDEDESLFLWSTRPGLRAIAWATTPSFTVAGTRPRLVHAASRAFAAPSLDRAYVTESLSGWSLQERTPYEGTQLLPVDSTLRIDRAGAAFLAHPTPEPRRWQHGLLFHQARVYRSALRQAAEPLRSIPGCEVRLSGGKDSRLVASVLYDRGIVPTTVACHGRARGPEESIAEQVARALHWTIRFDAPELAYLGSVLDSVRNNMVLADGLFATEPRHVAYAPFGFSGEQAPGIVYGHIQLQKGGWARYVSEKRDTMLEFCRQCVTPTRDFVAPEVTRAARDAVDRYASTLRVTHDAEYGYWINYRFRVCRWLIPHYLVHSHSMLPVYPLLDEKVARVVHSAPISMLVTEKLMFEATRLLAPALAELPLSMGRYYRFENHRPRKVVPLPLPDVPWPKPRPQRVDHHAALQEACAHIRSGALKEDLRELARPEVWRCIEDPTRERLAASGFEPRPLAAYLWTCYQASVLFSAGLPWKVTAPAPHAP